MKSTCYADKRDIVKGTDMSCRLPKICKKYESETDLLVYLLYHIPPLFYISGHKERE